MTKRRERLSPVIEAERRKSGVLERRAHGLEAECVQLGRDLKLAREAATKAVETVRSLQVQLARTRKESEERGWRLIEAMEWRDAEIARRVAIERASLWRIAAQRIAARFRRST
jgi:hypothetical protein